MLAAAAGTSGGSGGPYHHPAWLVRPVGCPIGAQGLQQRGQGAKGAKRAGAQGPQPPRTFGNRRGLGGEPTQAAHALAPQQRRQGAVGAAKALHRAGQHSCLDGGYS